MALEGEAAGLSDDPGQFENQQRAMQRLEVIVPIASLGISVLLFAPFRSVRSAALGLAMVPFTMVGRVGALSAVDLRCADSARHGCAQAPTPPLSAFAEALVNAVR